jgi:hypothetical protein
LPAADPLQQTRWAADPLQQTSWEALPAVFVQLAYGCYPCLGALECAHRSQELQQPALIGCSAPVTAAGALAKPAARMAAKPADLAIISLTRESCVVGATFVVINRHSLRALWILDGREKCVF